MVYTNKVAIISKVSFIHICNGRVGMGGRDLNLCFSGLANLNIRISSPGRFQVLVHKPLHGSEARVLMDQQK